MTEKEIIEIREKNTFLWENRLTINRVDLWLENFMGETCEQIKEKTIATKLLTKFIYYSEKEVKYLCKAAFSLFKRKRILENPSSFFATETKTLVKEFFKNCRFSYIGRASESGAFILYFFRQENSLPVEQFEDPASFELERTIREISSNGAIVFVDDFLGTGRTAIDFWNEKISPIISQYPQIKWYYVALVATKRGEENIQSSTGFQLICPQTLDDSYRVFHDSSKVFQITDREDAKKVCQHYGSLLVNSTHSLGYRDSQALIGFHHNIPDNTLPIIWSDRRLNSGLRWYPIFERKSKL